jgi:ribosome-binding protein aMBF1 (putative translation factor)
MPNLALNVADLPPGVALVPGAIELLGRSPELHDEVAGGQPGRNRKRCKLMRYSAQIRAARGLLGWSQNQLARRAGVGPATLQRIEQSGGIVKGNFSTILKIQKALEQAGIHFIEDDNGEIGVRLKMRTR